MMLQLRCFVKDVLENRKPMGFRRLDGDDLISVNIAHFTTLGGELDVFVHCTTDCCAGFFVAGMKQCGDCFHVDKRTGGFLNKDNILAIIFVRYVFYGVLERLHTGISGWNKTF